MSQANRIPIMTTGGPSALAIVHPATSRNLRRIAETVEVMNERIQQLASYAAVVGCLKNPERFTASERVMIRDSLEAAIEGLVSFLDDLDGDPDLEPNAGNSLFSGLDECEPDEETGEIELDHAEWGIGDHSGLIEQSLGCL